jgi:para-aminobenzoate synthetase/4-amino-4-deoxychorismate lyase
MLPNLHKAPFALLDNQTRNDEKEPSLFFSSPANIITTSSIADVPAALQKIDEAVKSGHYVAGWISYEAAYALEKKLAQPSFPLSSEPLVWMMVCDKPPQEFSPADIQNLLHAAKKGNQRLANLKIQSPQGFQDYKSALDTVKNYIVAGDVYQVNYTFPQDITLEGSPLGLYERLRGAQPVEYGAYIDTGIDKILSFSPELFVRCENGTLRSRPMKGTIDRGRYREEDEANQRQLESDPKARAENLMIVDLIRNDISKIADKGSVEVTSLFNIERYPTLWQMTSEITARCKANLKPSAVIQALFPCGSVTGAPKVRSMQIIQEIEKKARGVYCGAIGYFSPNGDFRLNVPIRTLVLNASKDPEAGEVASLPITGGRYSIGSGVVADSKIDLEYEECLLKGKFLNQETKPFSLIETMLLQDGEYRFLDSHMKRLEESAAFFDFKLNTDTISEQLEHIKSISDPGSLLRVRLLVDKAGTSSVTTKKMKTQPRIWSLNRLPQINSEPLATVTVTPDKVYSEDIFVFHKTTHRSLYDTVYKDAIKKGHIDSLFTNERDEITEGAITNLFVKHAGRWITPPISAGVLNGTLRDSLLEKREVSEHSITIDDLRRAEAIAIGNSVRGLALVQLEA